MPRSSRLDAERGEIAPPYVFQANVSRNGKNAYKPRPADKEAPGQQIVEAN